MDTSNQEQLNLFDNELIDNSITHENLSSFLHSPQLKKNPKHSISNNGHFKDEKYDKVALDHLKAQLLTEINAKVVSNSNN